VNPIAQSGAWTMRRWIILLITLSLMTLTASLGAWQMRRAAYKQQLAAQIEAQNRLLPGTNIDVLAPNFIANQALQKQWLQRRVQLQGRWLHAHTVFLDNRPMQVSGQPRVGFYVATPLALEGGDRVIWVQRGWVARDFQDRSKLPALPANEDTVTVSGRLIEQVSRAYEMKGAQAAASDVAMASRIWQNLPAVNFSPKVLLPVAVLQTEAEASDGLLRDWPAIDTGVAKHHGYAFQWFALSGTLFILYVWFQLIAPRRKQQQ
jgi:surfeit locus 1 family protein